MPELGGRHRGGVVVDSSHRDDRVDDRVRRHHRDELVVGSSQDVLVVLELVAV